MKRLRVAAVVGLLCWIGSSVALGNLSRDIRAILQDENLKNIDVGVAVVKLGESPRQTQVLFQHNSDRPFIPASNMKLITSAAAIDVLGADFSFRTSLLKRGEDLVVWADGDPTLGDTILLRPIGWDVDTLFRNWAGELKQRGITSVRNVVIDDSVFDEEFYHPGWASNYAHQRYAAQVGGLNLAVNTITFAIHARNQGEVVTYKLSPDTKYITVRNTCVMGENDAIWFSRQPQTNEIILRGETPNRTSTVQVTIHDPSMYAGTVLAETLQRQGVTVNGRAVRDRTTRSQYESLSPAQREEWKIVARHETPLAAVLPRFNKDSLNLYGEALNKRMGHAATGQSGSWENGSRAVSAFLKRIGAREEQFDIADGSGLARANTVSPQTLVQVLVHSYHQSSREMYVNSLAVGGGDGTLRNRFQNMEASGRVYAKSGFISGVTALSGYLEGKDGQWYAFSIMMNGIAPGTNATMRNLQDRIVNAVDRNSP
jgi:serine-type D-Ala-D-Ala carboxypeptidase/endopeptidase (penicillin-binding protein 4)